MSGKIRQQIDSIIAQLSKGDVAIAATVKVKLIIKGLNPDRFNAASEDDPEILARVGAAAKELGVEVN